MIQTVICQVEACGMRSVNGFCLNKLTSIGQNGVCEYLTKDGWADPVLDIFKNNFVTKEEKEMREPVQRILETSEGQENDRDRLQDTSGEN